MLFLTARSEALEAERRELLRTSAEPVVAQECQLNTLRGMGTNSAWLSVMEFCAWREFRNRKPVGAWVGLTPTPHQSGQSRHELGIAKAGNRHIPAMAIEMAWGWLRCQPESELARRYQARFGPGSARVRKIGIVALARKLLRPERLMLRWCGEPAVAPGSPGEPTVRWDSPAQRFIVRLRANTGWGGRRGICRKFSCASHLGYDLPL